MEASYEIPNLINQGKNVGTCKNPYFFHITSGERVKKTAIFHAQIGTNYYEYYIRWVNSETLNLMCTDRTCPAKALVKVRKESNLITIKGTKTKKNGSKQTLYQFDFSNPEARDLRNYIFCEKNSLPHTAHALSKLKILNPVRKDLREKHILLGLQTRRPEVDTALNIMNLQPKIGIQNETKVLGVPSFISCFPLEQAF